MTGHDAQAVRRGTDHVTLVCPDCGWQADVDTGGLTVWAATTRVAEAAAAHEREAGR